MKLIIRLLALPFFFVAAIIGLAKASILITYNFIRYGGESISHLKEDQASIAKIYLEMKRRDDHFSKNSVIARESIKIYQIGDEVVHLHYDTLEDLLKRLQYAGIPVTGSVDPMRNPTSINDERFKGRKVEDVL